MGASGAVSNAFNEVPVPVDRQQAFVREVAAQFGFDFSRGRLDESTHPFCSGSHCNDVRMTTRFHEANVNDALGSTMHETGHGLYEQGLLTEFIGTPMGDSVSLGKALIPKSLRYLRCLMVKFAPRGRHPLSIMFL